MTDLKTAARQALEALENIDKEFRKHGRKHWPEAVKAHSAIAPLRAALAEPVQEPDLSRCPNCASLEDQNTELDRKLAELERK